MPTCWIEAAAGMDPCDEAWPTAPCNWRRAALCHTAPVVAGLATAVPGPFFRLEELQFSSLSSLAPSCGVEVAGPLVFMVPLAALGALLAAATAALKLATPLLGFHGERRPRLEGVGGEKGYFMKGV